jgi:hypothetical protein
MRSTNRYLTLMLALAIGCRTSSAPADFQQGAGMAETGLEGIVRRGPIQPVCRVNEACDAPFSAGFQVEKDGKVVAAFHSDSAGRFQVHLFPGQYMVTPDSSAPLMAPRSQAQQVTVGPHGLTHVELNFDTGIR